MFLDFPKAFESGPHERLVLKLKGYGRPAAIIWKLDKSSTTRGGGTPLPRGQF